MDPQARIKVLCDQGNTVEVDFSIPLRRYYRSGMEMAKMAQIYEEEKNYESAFILYMRYITLFVEKIRNHPEFRNHVSVDKTTANKRLKEILSAAEKLKIVLKEKYQREYNEVVAHQRMIEKQLREEKEKKLKAEKERKSIMPDSKSDAKSFKEKWDNILITPYDGNIPEDSTVEDVVYPTDALPISPSDSSVSFEELAEPSSTCVKPHIPSRELKPSSPQSLPTVNRDSKPLSLLSAHSGKGEGLRTVIVPEKLMLQFLSLVESNTTQNRETCGILAGKLTRNRFMITHLLIPQQTATADSCTMQHEEELLDQQFKYDLITLGWIHTHPTQTAFMSSVDLHNHCSYQKLLPEAVAIVCAPKFNETGYFSLTQNYGISFITNCKEKGFHPHPSEPPLYQGADHIVLDTSLSVHVVDLRA